MSRTLRLVSVAISASTLVGLSTLPADAATIRTYRNVATGFCLDSSSGGSVYSRECNGGNYQKWSVSGSRVVTLRDYATGRCLDSNTSGRVYTLPCNSGNFQRWAVVYADSTRRIFRNYATGRCLDSNTARKVYTLSCNGGSFQKWRI